jgi:hypothetical protein
MDPQARHLFPPVLIDISTLVRRGEDIGFVLNDSKA